MLNELLGLFFGVALFVVIIVELYISHVQETGRDLDGKVVHGNQIARKRAKHISYKQVRYYTDFDSERGTR